MLLIWNNPLHSSVQVNVVAFNSLPENGIPPELLATGTDNNAKSDEDIVYDLSEMSAFMPVHQQQQQEIEARSQTHAVVCC